MAGNVLPRAVATYLCCIPKITRMIGQAKISNFFSVLPSKRLSSDDASPSQDGPDAKKQKVEGSPDRKVPEPVASPDAGADLSEEQRRRMEESKLAACAKLAAKKTEGVVVNMGHSWLKALQAEFSKPYFVELCKFVAAERNRGTVYPPPHQVFTWTQTCAIRDVKVVILGQDPYHGPRQAHGLCFSVQAGIAPPPSLENIYKELAKDIEGFQHPGHGDLTGWAKQGVLLLNACLTVKAHNANSHAGRGWEKFTDAAIAWLNSNLSGVVFILWGSYAQKKGAIINKKKHHILKGVHPSPLSAHRGFFGCKHFSECNRLLKSQGVTPIDWSHLPKQ